MEVREVTNSYPHFHKGFSTPSAPICSTRFTPFPSDPFFLFSSILFGTAVTVVTVVTVVTAVTAVTAVTTVTENRLPGRSREPVQRVDKVLSPR